MFANTITLTINAVDKVLTRINQDNFGSTYKLTSATELIQLQFRNSTEKNSSGDVDRHNMFVEHTVFATATEIEKYYSMSATLRARRGSSPTVLSQLTAGAQTVLTAQLAGLVQGES